MSQTETSPLPSLMNPGAALLDPVRGPAQAVTALLVAAAWPALVASRMCSRGTISSVNRRIERWACMLWMVSFMANDTTQR